MSRNLDLSLAFVEAHLLDAARILEHLSTEETASFLESVPSTQAADVCGVMDSFFTARCLERIQDRAVAEIFSKQSVQTASVLLRLMDERKRTSILQLLPKDVMAALKAKMRFPENSAGALMNPQVLTLFEDQNIREAARQILKNPKRLSFHLFVLTRSRQLLGAVTLAGLMLGEPKQLIGSIIHTGVVTLSPYLDLPTLLDHRGWQDYRELPVVDDSGVFLGVIDYPAIRQLESLARGKVATRPATDAGAALGELYWIGMSALFKGAATTVKTVEK